MEKAMANGNGTGMKPKVEIALNETATLKLLKDKPYSGDNSFGTYYLYSEATRDVLSAQNRLPVNGRNAPRWKPKKSNKDFNQSAA
jgi:adenine specific DNA methylase Mod